MKRQPALILLPDSDLARIKGAGGPPSVKEVNDYSINPRSLGAEMASGAVLGGIGAAAATGGPGFPLGAVGGALGGGIYYSMSLLVNPPTKPAAPPAGNQPWRPADMAVCH